MGGMRTATPTGGRRWRARGYFIALAAIGLIGFGILPVDEAAFYDFSASVNRWQVRPDFRVVALDYTVRGSTAMRTRPLLFIPARRIIMAMRSTPFLPKRFAVNPTSWSHYHDFSRGPLAAYLHLCGEQNVGMYLPMIEDLGRKPGGPSDADLLGFLDSFKMDFPVTKDIGALRGLGDLLRDIEPSRGFTVRNNVGELLAPHIASIARDLELPSDLDALSPEAQQAILDRLDGYVRRHDPELWRAKQVSDFCAGISAQVFSPPYQAVIDPWLKVTMIFRWLTVGMLAAASLATVRQARRQSMRQAVIVSEPAATPEPVVQPASC